MLLSDDDKCRSERSPQGRGLEPLPSSRACSPLAGKRGRATYEAKRQGGAGGSREGEASRIPRCPRLKAAKAHKWSELARHMCALDAGLKCDIASKDLKLALPLARNPL